jgi:hypothetical protein
MSLISYTPGGGSSVVGSTKSGGTTVVNSPPRVPSAFATINSNLITLTASYQVILQTTITTTSVGYILGNAVAQVINTDSTDHTATIYMEVNGSTSNTTSEDIRKNTAGVDGAANLTIIHRTSIFEPVSSYNITLYAKCDTNNGTVKINHADLFGLGNLM